MPRVRRIPVPAEPEAGAPRLEDIYGRFMTVNQIAEELRVSKSKVYRMVKDPMVRLPAPVHLGPNTTRWLTADYLEWVRGLKVAATAA